MAKTCSYSNCERGCYGELCLLHSPRKAIKSKPVKRRYTAEDLKWKQFRKDWISNHPPTVNDTYWKCYLNSTPMCPTFLTIDQLTLEHVIPKSRGYEYKYDVNNIKPSCIFCNNSKGSQILKAL